MKNLKDTIENKKIMNYNYDKEIKEYQNWQHILNEKQRRVF